MSPAGSPQASYEKLLDNVRKIAGDGGFVSLFLIHSTGLGSMGRRHLWQALERLLDSEHRGQQLWGWTHIEEMKAYATVWPPHVNQIKVSKHRSFEKSCCCCCCCCYCQKRRNCPVCYIYVPCGQLHPWYQQRVIDKYCKNHGIIVEAYSPLVRNYKASDPTSVGVVQRYEKTTAQILIRYSLQKGWVPLPKSDDPSRIAANADVYGFEIGPDDMSVLDNLDQGSAGAIVEAVANE